MKNKLTTILLSVLATVGVISLTSSNLTSAPQQGLGGAFPFNWATSGTFDTVSSGSDTIVSATSTRIFITEVGCGENWDNGKKLYVNRQATGLKVCVAEGMGTQHTNYQLNGANIAKIGPSVIKFSVNPTLVLEPGDSLEIASSSGSQGYWSGYTRP